MLFCSIGLTSNVFSVYQPYIIRINGFSYTQGSMLVTLRMISALLALFIIDKYYRIFDIRVGAFLSIVSIAIAYLIFASASQYWLYALGAFVSGIGYSLGAMIPVSIVVNRWFKAHKSLALGICSAGTGLATVIMPPVVTVLIETLGLQIAFLLEAILIFLIAILIFGLLRNSPSVMKMKPLGEEMVQESTKVKISSKCNIGEAEWVSMLVILFLLGGGGSNGFTHLGVLYTTENYDSMEVAFIISITGILLGIGKCVFGEVYDRIGSYRANYFFGMLVILGLVCCCLAPLHNKIILLFGIVTLGFGFPANNVGVPIWAGDLSTDQTYEKTLKSFQLAYTCGTMFFSVIVGISADIFGSYVPIYAVFTVISIIFFYVLQKNYRKAGLTGKSIVCKE